MGPSALASQSCASVPTASGVNIRAVVRFEWTKGRKRAAIGAASSLVLVLLAAFSFGPFVRSRVNQDASRRGVTVNVGHVRPGWFAVQLEDVTVEPEGTKGIHATIGSVTIDVGVTGSVKGIRASDVKLELEGDALAEIAAWRERHPTKGESGGTKTPVTIERAALAWKSAFGDEAATLDATGIAVTRDEKERTHRARA